jgi:hypothetical protein
LAEHQDLSYWQIIGGALAGILTGAGAVFGAKKRVVNVASDRVRTEIRSLQDNVLTMSQEIRHMQEAHKTHVATMERIEQEHDVIVAELFRELKSIGLALREVSTEVKYALKRVGE